MKRVGIGLWEKIVDIENIKYAHKRAKKGKGKGVVEKEYKQNYLQI